MLVLAIGAFTDPSKLGPYAAAEIATIHAHKAAGTVVSSYQRVDGKGVALKNGLMTTELTEIAEF
jgi:hypothetical protein